MYNESETVAKFEIMDGAPSKGESIPVRLFLGGFRLTPTYTHVCPHTPAGPVLLPELILIFAPFQPFFRKRLRLVNGAGRTQGWKTAPGWPQGVGFLLQEEGRVPGARAPIFLPPPPRKSPQFSLLLVLQYKLSFFFHFVYFFHRPFSPRFCRCRTSSAPSII